MAGRFSFTLEEYQQAAIIWRKPLQMLPIIGLKSSLQYMTGRPGIRFKENVGFLDADAQFAPYKATRRADVNLVLEHRTLETHFGNVVLDFEPNLASGARAPFAMVSEATAKAAGIEGALTVTGPDGDITLPCVADPHMPAGVVWIPQNSTGCKISEIGARAGQTVSLAAAAEVTQR